MSFVIGNKIFSNTLSADRIREYAENKHESPLVMTLWERVKDFFFGGETKECIRLLNDICHPPIASTTLEISQNFDALKNMAKGNYKDHFINSADGQFTITDNQNNTIISIAIYHKFYTLEVGRDKISHHNLFLAPFPPTAASFKEPMTPCGASEVYEKRLQIWCDETEDCQNEKRAQARDDIISARVNKNYTLTLKDCNLAALPPLCAPLSMLISRGNPLSRFNAPLPATLQEFAAEGIECLPKTFHPEFRTLKVFSSTALKEDDLDYLAVRAKNLEYLTVIGCDRKRLPCNLPTTLKFLHFANNSHLTDDALDDLADKLPKLEKLVIAGNALKRLPKNLPSSLKELIANNNQIEELSDKVIDQFPKLTLLDMSNNKLKKPPMTGEHLSGYLRVKTTGNQIPTSAPMSDNLNAQIKKELAYLKKQSAVLANARREDEMKFNAKLSEFNAKAKEDQDELFKIYNRDKEQYKALCDIEKEQYMKQCDAKTNSIIKEAQAIMARVNEMIEKASKPDPLSRNSRSNQTSFKRQQTAATPDKMKKNPTQPQAHSQSKRNKTVGAYAASKCVKNTSLGER